MVSSARNGSPKAARKQPESNVHVLDISFESLLERCIARAHKLDERLAQQPRLHIGRIITGCLVANDVFADR